MPPPFNFLKNLTNHQTKSVHTNLPADNTALDQSDASPKKLRRKSKKTTHGHIPIEFRPMDAFGGILGHEVDDIGPSRYPAHPFQSASGTAGSQYPHPNAHKFTDNFHDEPGHSKEPPIMSNRSQYSTMQGQDSGTDNFQTSTPQPSDTNQRRYGAQAANSFVTPDETPDVSQYMVNGQRYTQGLVGQPPPSRSWSPIPSVHRESVHDNDEDEDYSYTDSPKEEGVEQGGYQSWVEDGNLGNRFSADVTDPRISTTADPGQPDSMSIHTIHYFEYPDQGRTAHATIPRSTSAHSKTQPNIPKGENAARRQPSQTYLQPPLPQPPPPPRRPMESGIIESPMLEHQYWGEEEAEPEVYHYIVPAGVKVIFQDQEGNIIARIGKDGTVEDLSQSAKSAPIVVHDEYGRELYRSKNIRGPSPTPRELRQGHFRTHIRSTYEEHNLREGMGEISGAGGYRRRPPWLSQPSSISTRSTKTIMIDEKGNQIALKSPSLHRDGGRRLENHDVSYQARVSYV